MKPISCPDCGQNILLEEVKLLVEDMQKIQNCYPVAIYAFLTEHTKIYQECPNYECSNIIRSDDSSVRKCELCNSEIDFDQNPSQCRYSPAEDRESFENDQLLDSDGQLQSPEDNRQISKVFLSYAGAY